MSADQANQNVSGNSCVHMEAVDRISKLPVVESTIGTATNIYGKVKDYNSLTNWTLSTAENTVCKAVEVGKPYATPVVQKLEGPIKTVDGLLCSGLDYVEAKVPSVKLPPGEMYETTKNTVGNTVQAARNVVEPAVQTAKNIVEPAVQSAKNIVEPLVQPAVEKAKEFLHAEKTASDCAECDGDNTKN